MDLLSLDSSPRRRRRISRADLALLSYALDGAKKKRKGKKKTGKKPAKRSAGRRKVRGIRVRFQGTIFGVGKRGAKRSLKLGNIKAFKADGLDGAKKRKPARKGRRHHAFAAYGAHNKALNKQDMKKMAAMMEAYGLKLQPEFLVPATAFERCLQGSAGVDVKTLARRYCGGKQTNASLMKKLSDLRAALG